MNNIDAIEARERAKYETTWGSHNYRIRSPGEFVARAAFHVCNMYEGQSLIDFGCGTGRAGAHFDIWGLNVIGVDIADNCLDEPLGKRIQFVRACLWDLPDDLPPAEWGYCTDVLEHIPPEFVGDVLAGIAAHTSGAFLQIAHFPDGEWIEGTGPLHLTVEPREWWALKLTAAFEYCEDVTEFVGNIADDGTEGRSSWLVKS